MINIILKDARVISPEDNINEIVDIKIENGIITALQNNISGEGIDMTGKLVTPGFVEMHCHLREPGFEYKETIETGINSAISGGYTAICPMANTNPVVDNVDTIKFCLEKAAKTGKNILFPVCAITKNLAGEEVVDFKSLKEAGAIAFSDDGKPLENLVLFKEALQSGELVISHAEDSKLLTESISEAVCVARELEVLRAVGGRLHFAHISTKRALELIKEAKDAGLNVTCETAPHYFTFTENDKTQDGIFKMNPPLRTQEDLDAVIKALKDGTIDCIATDHAPHSLEEKHKEFSKSPFGIVGFETALSATLRLVKSGRLTINQAIEKLSSNPAKILGLKNQGRIKIGEVANLAVINPHQKYVVDANNFKTKCKISPFEGMEMTGKTIAVILNGELIEIGAELCKQMI